MGILGGTFNPPHLGHLICGQEAHRQLGLDTVVLVPAGVPPHKPAPSDPGAEMRLELCRLAVGGDERFAVSRIEIDRPGPSYTVDTLRAVHEHEPGDELTLIVGGDMAQTLADWRDPQQVLDLARVAVAERSGVARADVANRLTALGAEARVDFFDMPRIDISSSLVRDRVARGDTVRYLVPDAVARCIADRGLYRSAA